VIKTGENATFETYCFDEAKLIRLLLKKHTLVMRHLEKNYYQGLSQSKAKRVATEGGGVIVKQERKSRGLIKSEEDKEEEAEL
jgi:hypothetical protein